MGCPDRRARGRGRSRRWTAAGGAAVGSGGHVRLAAGGDRRSRRRDRRVGDLSRDGWRRVLDLRRASRVKRRVGGRAPLGLRVRRPVALAGPQRDTGADIQLAYPQLAMSATGHAVVAWSSPAGAMAAFRSPGEEIGAAQRVLPADFVVRSAAIAGDGQTFLGDGTGRVAIRPAGGAFGAPAALPGSAIPYGPPALLAANASGDALAAYRGDAAASWSAAERPEAVGANPRRSPPSEAPARAPWRCRTAARAWSPSRRAPAIRGPEDASTCSRRRSHPASRRQWSRSMRAAWTWT